MSLRRLTVFCGSSNSAPRVYFDAARGVGEALAEREIGVVYGGGHVGLMGALADGALARGGEVIGVIPTRLMDRELGHEGVTQLLVVDTMHERKHRMAELGDAFIALPGGFGTLEEIFEQVTWAQLGYHEKPSAVLDVNGFYEDLFAFLARAGRDTFIRPAHLNLLQRFTDLDELLAHLAS
ncbi:MAG: LOG family protein [Planctomycetota bacterium]|jgi:uncharacterized protein (TIGR00730 family)